MTATDRIIHRPVLLQEIRSFLRQDYRMLVDGTTGEGGHSEMMLQHYPDPVCLLCLDWDRGMLERAKTRLLPYSEAHRVIYVHGNFKDLAAILQKQNQQADFVLLDLGISTRHYVASGRGFSFSDDAPLDLRINHEQGQPLSAILPGLTQKHLADIIHHLSDERLARPIARAIHAHRHDLKNARQLKVLIERTVGHRYHDHIHPATRTFMALRIFINQELDNLVAFLDTIPALLRPLGRLAVISFHSLEDRLVKHAFRRLSRREKQNKYRSQKTRQPAGRVLCKKPIRPGAEEIAGNRQARSAKLRVFERSAS